MSSNRNQILTDHLVRYNNGTMNSQSSTNTKQQSKSPVSNHQSDRKSRGNGRKSGILVYLSHLKPLEIIFVLVLVVAFLAGGRFLVHLLNHVDQRAAAHPEKLLPKTSDFAECLIYIALFAGMRLLFVDRMFAKLGDFVLPKNKWDATTRLQKYVLKTGILIHMILFFVHFIFL